MCTKHAEYFSFYGLFLTQELLPGQALQSASPESLRTDLAVFTQHSAQSEDVTSLPLSFSEIVLLHGEEIFRKDIYL